jgi:flagellar filament outer layer protein Flaa
MKRGFRLFFVYLLLFTMALPVTLIADTSTQNIVSQVLETFDPDDSSFEWYVQGSKFIAEGYPRFKLIDGFPFALYGRAGDEGNHQVLGMQGSFDRTGFNYLEIFPVEDGPDGKVPAKMTIPGRVKELDLWVWGSQYNYTFEVHVEDYRGYVHVLPMGSLNFAGWNNLRIRIPSYIPLNQVYIPNYRDLKLIKFVLRTEPTENVAGFDFYMDHIKVLTDVFESRFDGDEFVRPESRAEIWPEEEE